MALRSIPVLLSLAALSFVGIARAQDVEEPATGTRGGHGESCRARVDCGAGLVCVDNKCLNPGETPPAPPPPPASGSSSNADIYDQKVPWRGNRIGIYYMITPPVAGNLKNIEAGHSVGLENTSRLFAELRYRATFGYTAYVGGGSTVHGFRADMLSLSYTFTVAKGDAIRFGIEPVLNLINLETYFPNSGSVFLFSSGFSVGAIIGFADGHGYFSVEPIGMDFRWLQAGNGIQTTADVGANWRGRVSVGIAF